MWRIGTLLCDLTGLDGRLTLRREVYSRERFVDGVEVDVTLTPGEPDAISIPTAAVRWCGECEHFEDAKRRLERIWRVT